MTWDSHATTDSATITGDAWLERTKGLTYENGRSLSELSTQLCIFLMQ
ncbi:MAG: hypothetical protein OXC13_14300 [Caldilineaceae bacterium]|nr:hypothetical protein [Caldilineaceae bacterium]